MNFYKSIITACLMLCSAVSSASSNDNICDNLAGTWEGSANIKVFVFSCGYDAVLQVPEGNPALVNINARKSSGSFLCPGSIQRDIMGKCDQGKVTLKDDRIDVSGELSSDGLSANISGTISVMGRHPLNITVKKVS